MIRLSITIACVLTALSARSEAQVYASPQSPTPQVVVQPVASDPYGFGPWLNSIRASRGLRPLAYDVALSAAAAWNSSRGFGHHGMHGARRQNAGMGPLGTVESMWLRSPAHASALLDPSITLYGIANVNGNWTYNAR